MVLSEKVFIFSNDFNVEGSVKLVSIIVVKFLRIRRRRVFNFSIVKYSDTERKQN